MFMRVDDIASNLFTVKCTMLARENFDSVYSGAKEMPFIYKFLQGHLCLIFLLLVILGPLITFSSLNPALGINPVVACSVDVVLQSANGSYTFDLFHTDQVSMLHSLTPQQFDKVAPTLRSASENQLILTDDWSDSVQQIQFLPFGDSIWEITPPGYAIMESMLLDNSTAPYNVINIQIELQFKRNGPASNLNVVQVLTRSLTQSQRLAIAEINNSTRGVLVMDQMIPRVIRLPATTSPVVVDDNVAAWHNVSLTIASKGGKSWWVLEDTACSSAVAGCGLNIYAASDKIVNGISFLSSYSVAALYIGVVYTIARLMRTVFQSYPWQVSFDELPYPDDLMELCDGISLARSGRYEGNLRDEIKLWEILISLFRNPAVLMRITRPKIKLKED